MTRPTKYWIKNHSIMLQVDSGMHVGIWRPSVRMYFAYRGVQGLRVLPLREAMLNAKEGTSFRHEGGRAARMHVL